jgi:hypothetical protein
MFLLIQRTISNFLFLLRLLAFISEISRSRCILTMLPKSHLNHAVTLFITLHIIATASGQCNPLTATCLPTPGLGTSTYFIDFAQQTSLPPNWTTANYETVTYGPNGAEFRFAKRYDAPYIWTNFHILFGHVETVV